MTMTPHIVGDDPVQRYLSRARELRASAAETDDSEKRTVLFNAADAYEDLAGWKPVIRNRDSDNVFRLPAAGVLA